MMLAHEVTDAPNSKRSDHDQARDQHPAVVHRCRMINNSQPIARVHVGHSPFLKLASASHFPISPHRRLTVSPITLVVSLRWPLLCRLQGTEFLFASAP